MKIHKNSVGNFAFLYNRYVRVRAAYGEIWTDRHAHWCEENPEMETLRQNAEHALLAYLRALETLSDEEERAITAEALKKKSLF